MAKVRTKVPDGKGGWAEVEGEAVAGGAVDLEKQRKALREEFYAGAGGLTEQFWKYGRLHAQESNLSDDQIAFAIALLCVNVRETFPAGTAKFDALSAEAETYFERVRERGT